MSVTESQPRIARVFVPGKGHNTVALAPLPPREVVLSPTERATANAPKRPVVRVDDNGVEVEFPSLRAACRVVGVSSAAISYALKYGTHAALYRWRYADSTAVVQRGNGGPRSMTIMCDDGRKTTLRGETKNQSEYMELYSAMRKNIPWRGRRYVRVA